MRSFLAKSLLGALAFGAMVSAANAAIVINEVLGSTTGTDSEFIELWNSGPGPVDISGWRVELWDSDAGASYGGSDGGAPYIVPAATTLAAGDYWVMANTTFGTFYSASLRDQLIQENAIENSSYTIILKDSVLAAVDSFFVTDGGAGDSANDAGAAHVPISGTVGPDGSNLPAGFYRVGDGNAATALLEFSPQPAPSATPGAANIPEPASVALLGLGALAVLRRR